MLQSALRQGETLRQEGRPADALAHFVQAIGLLPPQSTFDAAVLHTLKACCLQDLRRFEEALAATDDAIAADPTYMLAWVNRGNCLDELGRLDESLGAYDRALTLDPGHANGWCDRGYVLKKLGRLEAAVDSYDRSLAINPADPVTWSNKGNSLLALGRPQDAVQCYDRALAINPQFTAARDTRAHVLDRLAKGESPAAPPADPLAAQLAQADAHAQTGRLTDALSGYDAVLQVAPGRADVWAGKAAVLKALGRMDDAVAANQQALDLDANNAPLWFNHANTLLTMDRAAEAIPCYDRALALDPSMRAVWFNRGAALEACLRWRDAAASFERAIAVDPTYARAAERLARLRDPQILIEMARHMGQNQQHQASLDLTELALEAAPAHVPLLTLKAISLLSLGRQAEAVPILQQALRLDPQDATANAIMKRLQNSPPPSAEALVERGSDLIDAGRLDEALTCFQQACEVDPTDGGAWMGRAMLLVGLERREEALPCFDRVIALRPDWAGPLLQKADCLETLQRYEEAVAHFDRAIVLEPANLAPVHDRAHCLTRLGRVDEALASYTRVITLDPRFHLSWHNKAELERQLGRFDDAQASYEACLSCAPAQAASLIAHAQQQLQRLPLGRAQLALQNGAFHEAVKFASSLAGSDLIALWTRGRALLALERHAEALADLSIVVQNLEATGRGVPDALYVESGICMQAGGRIDDALAQWAKASPMSGRRWLREGLVARERGDAEKAEEYLRRAEEAFTTFEFAANPPDPLAAIDIRLLWQVLGRVEIPHEAPPAVRQALAR